MADENEKQIEVISSIKQKRPELVNHCYSVGLWIWAEFTENMDMTHDIVA